MESNNSILSFFHSFIKRYKPKRNIEVDLELDFLKKLSDNDLIVFEMKGYQSLCYGVVVANSPSAMLIGMKWRFGQRPTQYGSSEVFPYAVIRRGIHELNKDLFSGRRAPALDDTTRSTN